MSLDSDFNHVYGTGSGIPCNKARVNKEENILLPCNAVESRI